MFNWLDVLPVELVGTNVLGMLSIRAYGSQTSHQLIMDLVLYCAPVKLPEQKQTYYPPLQ